MNSIDNKFDKTLYCVQNNYQGRMQQVYAMINLRTKSSKDEHIQKVLQRLGDADFRTENIFVCNLLMEMKGESSKWRGARTFADFIECYQHQMIAQSRSRKLNQVLKDWQKLLNNAAAQVDNSMKGLNGKNK